LALLASFMWYATCPRSLPRNEVMKQTWNTSANDNIHITTPLYVHYSCSKKCSYSGSLSLYHHLRSYLGYIR
jgi:hypothetical protein